MLCQQKEQALLYQQKLGSISKLKHEKNDINIHVKYKLCSSCNLYSEMNLPRTAFAEKATSIKVFSMFILDRKSLWLKSITCF